MIKNIYKMGLNETDTLDAETQVKRVPGGWIYSTYNGTRNSYSDPCFVPFNNEFMETSETAELAATDSQQLKQAIAFLERAEKSAIDDNWLKDVRCFLIDATARV